MRIHDLKCWPVPFDLMINGTKTCEVRRNDRDFRSGDLLLLREWIPPGNPQGRNGYTGREMLFEVTWLLNGSECGHGPDLCIMGTRPVYGPAYDLGACSGAAAAK